MGVKILLPEFHARRLKILLPEWKPQGDYGTAVYAIWLPHRYMPSKLRVFLDFLIEQLPYAASKR